MSTNRITLRWYDFVAAFYVIGALSVFVGTIGIEKPIPLAWPLIVVLLVGAYAIGSASSDKSKAQRTDKSDSVS